MCVRAHLPIGGYQPPLSVPSAVPQMKRKAALPGQGLCSSIPEIMRDISLLFFICLSFFFCAHTHTHTHTHTHLHTHTLFSISSHPGTARKHLFCHSLIHTHSAYNATEAHLLNHLESEPLPSDFSSSFWVQRQLSL